MNKTPHRTPNFLVSVFLCLAVLLSFVQTPIKISAANVTTAPIAVVMCFDTGEILHNTNMMQRWIPASKTKSMTAFIVYQEIEAGNLSLDTYIRVSANAARFSQDRRVQGSFVPLNSGQYITVEMLLRLMMLPSANAAAVVLAEHISGSQAEFVERMNEEALLLGMYAGFLNAHGAEVHHSNAYSQALLIREFITRFPDILRITAMPTVTFNGQVYNSTNRLLSTHPFYGADGFKTGSLRQAGWGHSTTAIRDGRRIIAVLMNTPSNEARQQQSRVLLDYGFSVLENRERELSERIRVFHCTDFVPLGNTPTVIQGRALLPAYCIFEWLGYSVTQHSHGIVMLESAYSTITLFLDRNLAIINQDTHVLPAQYIDGNIFVCIEFVAKASATNVVWNTQTGLLHFRTN